jgi:hypothetical protein
VPNLQKIQKKKFQVDCKGDVSHISNSCFAVHSELSYGVGMCMQEIGIKSLIYLPFHMLPQNTVGLPFEIRLVDSLLYCKSRKVLNGCCVRIKQKSIAVVTITLYSF